MDFITESTFVERFILTLKFISAVVGSISFIGIVYVSLATIALREKIEYKRKKGEQNTAPITDVAKAEWAALKERLDVASDSEAALLIIQADAIVDKALKLLRIPGETMGERLKSVSGADFKNSDAIWEAHKLRNQIAHEHDKKIHYSDAIYAVKKFEGALEELGVL